MTLKANELAAIRTTYEMGQLNEGDVSPDPIAQFQRWFDEALEKQVMEPNAMTLATVSTSGQPSARIVLLKQLDEQGFGFFTNYESRKGEELAESPQAALLFFWPELQRQVRIEGRIEKMPAALSDAYFGSRPRGSQLGAVVSPQSQVVINREWLDAQYSIAESRYTENQRIPRPVHWGGYWLRPDVLEFWQGRGGRLHDRLVYYKKVDQWTISRLAP